jgi:imidazolonepropionase
MLVPGALADLVILDAPSYTHLPYRPGSNLVWKVVKGGEGV